MVTQLVTLTNEVNLHMIALQNIALAISLLIGQTPLSATPAQLLKLDTDLPTEPGWWVVPQGVEKMTIYAEAKNTETVLFWLIPTGTQTWRERQLIGYDKDGSDGWSLTWEFGNQRLHHHIHAQALGSDSNSQSNGVINIRTEMQ
ncbi:hypothetical protein [Cohnella sp. GbtcB17]|uniref:hypothetical protein n=1 Tax=Cohnella sp. GbtcB17 TaxID=2824762 RepID=UPI0020C70A7B|nr:hypothetical protein [Cohnella sp. GbtcB17]